jgi:hypothetical protein
MKLKAPYSYALAAVFLLVIFHPAQSNGTVVAIGVPTLATAYSSQRKIVSDVAGRLYAVYLALPQRKNDLNFTQVYLSESEDNGTTWRVLGQVSSGPYNSERATIITDADGRLRIFWTKFVGEQEYGQIFYRIFDHGSFSSEQQLTSSAAYSGYPSAAIDSKGVLHLVWYGYDGVAYQVFYSRYDSTTWSPPIRLSQGYPDSLNPTVAVDSKDNVYVAWYKSNGRYYEINSVRWNGAWVDHAVLSHGRTDAVDPSMAVDAQDHVNVVWSQGNVTQSQLYFAQLAQGKWSLPVSITSGQTSSVEPSIAAEGEAGLYVMYAKDNGQIYMKHREAGVWSLEEKMTSTGFNSYPSVRWSYYYNPQYSGSARLDYVWTSLQGTVSTVRYGSTPIPTSVQIRSGNAALTSYLAAGVAIVALGVLITVYKRPWSRRKR